MTPSQKTYNVGAYEKGGGWGGWGRRGFTCMGMIPSQENRKLAQLSIRTVHSIKRHSIKNTMMSARNRNCSSKILLSVSYMAGRKGTTFNSPRELCVWLNPCAGLVMWYVVSKPAHSA